MPTGYDASMFTLSLPRNYRNQQVADFARVEGLPGTYMANQLEATIFEDPSSIPYDKNFNDYLQTKAGVLSQARSLTSMIRICAAFACSNISTITNSDTDLTQLRFEARQYRMHLAVINALWCPGFSTQYSNGLLMHTLC